MRRLGWCVAGLALVVACSRRNPDYCDEDEPCPDPAKPFCDLDGLVDGSPNSCIGVSCTPGDFVACDEDRAIQCNTAGNNYDMVVCERGCDPVSNGCRLCDPGETACTNGIAATCDANGAVVSMEACALGCFDSEPRCRKVDPSNGLATYLDMAAAAPALELDAGSRISTISGNVVNGAGEPIAVPSFMIAAPTGGVPIRVFLASRAALADLTFEAPSVQAATPAFALVSASEVLIEGVIDLTFSVARIPPGSKITGACVGGGGDTVVDNGSEYIAAGGGGGGQTAGGDGGIIEFLAGGNAGGLAAPNPPLEPLVGGCAGSFGDIAGGGAVQIVAAQRIALAAGAVINAGGEGGRGDSGLIGGGGSGGGILLEAPIIELGASSALVANGGAGCSGRSGGAGQPGQVSTAAAIPGDCTGRPANLCGVGGAGGAIGSPPGNGGDLVYTNQSGIAQWSGGGGGSVGHIRLNTRDGAFTASSDAILSPVPTTALVRTR